MASYLENLIAKLEFGKIKFDNKIIWFGRVGAGMSLKVREPLILRSGLESSQMRFLQYEDSWFLIQYKDVNY